VCHFLCPIFFVFIATGLPWIIVKATLNAEDQQAFLDPTVNSPRIAKPWPGFDAEFMATVEEAPYRYSDVGREVYGVGTFYGGGYASQPPYLTPLFAKQGRRTQEDWGACQYYIESCHCQTLAIVGPASVTTPFKAYLEERYEEWDSLVDDISVSSDGTKLDPLSNAWSWYTINEAWNYLIGGIYGRRLEEASGGIAEAAARKSSLSAILDSVADRLPRHPGDVGLAEPRSRQRRLQRGRGQDDEYDPDDPCTWHYGGEIVTNESLFCDVNEGHSKPIFRIFSSVEAVDDWANDENYGRYSRDRSESSSLDRLCGAVVFENDASTVAEPKYTIRLNVTFQENDVSGFLTNSDVSDSTKSAEALKWYYNSGFLAMQAVVQRFIGSSRTTGGSTDPGGWDQIEADPHFIFAPTLEERFWIFGEVAGGILGNPIILTAMFGPIVSAIAYYMSRERSTRQRELLRMMGLSDASLIWAWIIMFVVLNFFIAFGMAVFFEIFFFKNSNIILIWTLLWFFANATTTLGMAVSTFVSTDRMAAMSAFGLFFGISFTAVALQPETSAASKTLWSLLPNNAFLQSMGTIWAWETRGIGASFGNAGDPIDNFDVNTGIGMLFLDFWLYLALYYYADSVIPWHNVGVPRKPWFCFTATYWREVMGKPPVITGEVSYADVESQSEASAGGLVESEDDAHLKSLVESKKVVIIRNLFKKFWNASGHEITAVNNLSLTMYQDECFCLLGHNGAGKTTTMMMLTGCMPQTSGTIEVKGSRVPEEIRTIRSSMGFCPQHNVLIDELTVMEHLELFGTIGGMTFEGLQARGRELLVAVALLDKIEARASALSGGMKRKLSCALAFLSEPYLVILDEPSSGMDPFARRGMWDTLKRWRTGHILCLTTHYMDEADALGDRIAIMSDGALACGGSSNFLKKKFGLGYIISFAKTTDKASQDSQILHAMRDVIKDVEVMSSVGKELLVQVPFAAAQQFPRLFPLLDSKKEELGIEAYGTSITNLEEVFLRVAKIHREEKARRSSSSVDKVEASETLVKTEASTKRASFFLQVYALLLRRIRFGYRNRLSCACQICLPMACVFAFCGIIFATTSFALPALVMNTDAWNIDVGSGPQAPITVGVANSLDPAAFTNLWQGMGDVEAFTGVVGSVPYPVTTGPDGQPLPQPFDVLDGLSKEASFVQLMDSRKNAQEASQYGSIFYTDQSSWCPAQGAWNGLPTRQICSANPGPTVAVNVTSHHSASIMYNLHASAVLKGRFGSGIDKLQVTNHPFQKTRKQAEQTEFVAGLLAATIIMASYGFIPSGATSYVVMEKEKDVKNQLIISGCSYAAYWTSNFIFDIIFAIIPCAGAIIIFHIFSLDAFIEKPGLEASIALFVAFLPASAGFAYLFAFLFSKSGIALFVSWIFNMLAGILATILISILQSIQQTYSVASAFRWICRFIPVYSLGYGHLMISVKQRQAATEDVGAITGLGVGGAKCIPEDEVSGEYIEQWYCTFMVGDEFLILILSGLFYLALAIFIDVVFGLPCCKKRFAANISSWLARMGGSQEDSAVLDEKARVKSIQDVSKQFVYVNDIHKVYNGRCHAVRGISFAADEGQVFGLLGVNGAGKTSTFKMLCGQVEPSAGSISIQGFDVTTNAAEARRLIGYCPQFDALLDSLTTKEHLELYGRLKGLNSRELDAAVQQQIQDLDLSSYVYSRAGQLSGGNKRKTSVAMATIGEPPMVFLDEPSAGMDPVARRGMWSVIQNIADKRKKSVVILTTHSMEEAEALCSRIAIQVDGQFRCLGTAQQIKSRYGQGLELNVRLTTPNTQELEDCVKKLCAGTSFQSMSSTDASAAIQRLDNGARILQEMNSRPGSPLISADVELHPLAEWILLIQRTQAFEEFAVQSLRAEAQADSLVLQSLEKSQNVIRYQIMPAALQGKFKSLGELFNLFQESKQRLHLEDFQVCQPSLEQIFNRFASTQIAQQAGAQAVGPPSTVSYAQVAPETSDIDVQAMTQPLPGQVTSQWIVDNTSLKAETPGLGFRRVKDPAALVSTQTFVGATWGSVVDGVKTEDGWLQVGQLYLPLEVRGVPVIKQKETQAPTNEPTPQVVGQPQES
jgi:ABC-type multidrug transport system ATPase subunit